MGGIFLEEKDWEAVEMMLEFLQVFYLATTVFFNIYILSNYTALHNIYEITKYFAKYKDHNPLLPTIVPIDIKF